VQGSGQIGRRILRPPGGPQNDATHATCVRRRHVGLRATPALGDSAMWRPPRPSDKSLGYSHTPLRGVALGRRPAGALAWVPVARPSDALALVDAHLGRWLRCPARAPAGRCLGRPADHAKMRESQGGLRPQPNAGAPAAVMLSEAKHLACLRQSARFFVAALLRMTGGATAAARYMRAKQAARKARRAHGRPRARRAKAATQDSTSCRVGTS